jgi:hypothetical protein
MARLLVLPLCLSLVAACGDDHDHNHHHHDGDQFTCDGDEDSLAPGTTKVGAGGKLKLKIVEAIPAQHYVQNNELIVTVTDANDQPLDDANFTSIIPFTAKHDHGTPVDAKWEAAATAGDYRLYDINYVHQGPWKLDMELSAGGETDSVGFVFCIKEPPGTPDAGA